MSRVYFHSPSDTAELQGSERAYFGGLATDIGLKALGISDRFDFDNDKFIDALEPVARRPRNRDHLATVLRVDESELSLRFNGDTHNVWHLFLNATLAVGNDAMCFAARLHAQCEVHGWIAGEDREWLAGVIESARASGLYRSGMGWEQIATFLRSNTTEPVVLSYSVCDGFPNRHTAGSTTKMRGRACLANSSGLRRGT